MKQEFFKLKINTNDQKLYDFTNQLHDQLKKNEFKNGILNLSIQHTSASLIVQENADPDVQTDLINYFNKFFRKITKDKVKITKILEIKGRQIKIENFYKGVIKFNFDDLCDRNLGSEDYINIANICNFLLIKNLPNFNENNSNQQQRFITLIDIIYEKKIPLMITSNIDLKSIDSSKSLIKPFKRTISRLYELTSITTIK